MNNKYLFYSITFHDILCFETVIPHPQHADRLEKILDRLNAANEIKDMNYPGSNLHKLTGDKKDQHAVKVSGNWRVFFKFIDGDAYVVDYDDYH